MPLAGGWIAAGDVFARADDDVIDWLRATTADRWQTYNMRDVDTLGVELGVQKTFAGGVIRARAIHRASTSMRQPSNQLSKYVLDYAPHSFVAAGAAIPLPAAFSVAPRLEYRRRSRSTGTSDYVLLDTRLGTANRTSASTSSSMARTCSIVSYQEIAGVAMPGAAFSVSLAVRR